jgi:hypothetical protein
MKLSLSVPIASAEAIEKFALFFLKLMIVIVGGSVFGVGACKLISSSNPISLFCGFVWAAAGIALLILFAVIHFK